MINKLVEDNLKLVYSVMWKHYPQYINDDVYQCGCIGLWKAAESYDPDKGAFSTHTYYWIRCYIHNHVIKLYTKKRSLNNSILPLEDFAEDHASPIDEAVNNFMLDSLINKLDNTDKFIIRMKLVGYTQREVADLLGISQIRVSQRERRAIAKMRKAMAV